MNYKQFEFRLAQLERAIQTIKTNKYSDQRKTDFQENLFNLVTSIRKANYKTFSENTLNWHKRIFDVIFTWVDFLDGSTLNQTPYEMVNCLQCVLKEWLGDYNNYFIVTSVNNKLDQYSFQSLKEAELSTLKKYVHDNYGITLTHDLIQINMSRYLVNDYLANVVLYHEVGHFINSKFKITTKAINELEYKDLPPGQLKQLINYWQEHFADLFAAQYVGQAASHYLELTAAEYIGSALHPATDKRIRVVDDFLAGNDNEIVEHLKKATQAGTEGKKQLRNGYKPLTRDDFDKLIPIEVKEEAELHSLFALGWDIWLDENSYLRTKFNIDRCSQILNNLIEKSISNYFITLNWKKINVSQQRGDQGIASEE